MEYHTVQRAVVLLPSPECLRLSADLVRQTYVLPHKVQIACWPFVGAM